MRKVTICGLRADRDAVLESLQDMGCVHVIPVAAPRDWEADRMAGADPEPVQEAVSYLRQSHHLRRPLPERPGLDVKRISEDILANKRRLRDLSDRRDFLRHRIKQIEPWGNFQLPAPEDMGGFRFWFYVLPHRHRHCLAGINLSWHEVGRTDNAHYIVVLSKDEPPGDLFPVRHVELGMDSLETLEKQLEQTEIDLEEAEFRRVAYTQFIQVLGANIMRAADEAALADAARQTVDEEGIFAVQGWVPEPQLGRIRRYALANRIAILVEDPEPGELPPTLLKNSTLFKAGEDLTNFYQTPNAFDWDPSSIVFLSLVVFFAITLSDAGYGLLIVIGAVASWRRLGKRDWGHRARILFLALGLSGTCYGVLTGSYFGVHVGRESLLGGLRVIESQNTEAMMRLAIYIGLIHVALANAVVVLRHWPHRRGFASIGWILVLAAGFLLWSAWDDPSEERMLLGTTSGIGGIAMILLFSSQRPIHRPADWLWRMSDGLLSLTNLTKIFGDVLSYLRLFALGLASAALATTFNQLAGQIEDKVKGVGLLLAILVLAVGHGLNFVLAIASGIVHGLRLNFIEFYNWGLSDEGYPFNPLRKREQRIE